MMQTDPMDVVEIPDSKPAPAPADPFPVDRRVGIVFLEGNVGAGKSTLLAEIEARGIARVHPEPLELWSESLARMHDMEEGPEDRRRPHAYDLQTRVLGWYESLLPRLLSEPEVDPPAVHVVERSPLSAVRVFCPYWESRGLLTPTQRRHLESRAAFLEQTVRYGSRSAYAFLDTPAETCADRVAERGDRLCVQAQCRALVEKYADMAGEVDLRFVDGTAPLEAQVGRIEEAIQDVRAGLLGR